MGEPTVRWVGKLGTRGAVPQLAFAWFRGFGTRQPG